LSSPIHRLFELGAIYAGFLYSRVEGVRSIDEDDEIESNWIVDIWHWRWRLRRRRLGRWAAKTLASDANIVKLGFGDHRYSCMDVDFSMHSNLRGSNANLLFSRHFSKAIF